MAIEQVDIADHWDLDAFQAELDALRLAGVRQMTEPEIQALAREFKRANREALRRYYQRRLVAGAASPPRPSPRCP